MKRAPLFSAVALCLLVACTRHASDAGVSAPAIATTAAKPAAVSKETTRFTPPAESDLPSGPFGEMVRLGRDIFVDTRAHAADYVGNGLNCNNCHLDAGRLANSAPLWGAYGAYPQYRKKDGRVNTLGVRMQGCFRYSMNGKAPPLDSTEMVALETYAYWLASGAPVGAKLAGAGLRTRANGV
jgi:thiosulfate dehydrogenase